MTIFSLNQTWFYFKLKNLLGILYFRGPNSIHLMFPVPRNCNFTDSPLNLHLTAPEQASTFNNTFGFFAPFKASNQSHSYFANITKHVPVPLLLHLHFSHLRNRLNVGQNSHGEEKKKPLALKKVYVVHEQISPQYSHQLLLHWVFKQMHCNWKSMKCTSRQKHEVENRSLSMNCQCLVMLIQGTSSQHHSSRHYLCSLLLTGGWRKFSKQLQKLLWQERRHVSPWKAWDWNVAPLSATAASASSSSLTRDQGKHLPSHHTTHDAKGCPKRTAFQQTPASFTSRS